MLKILKLHNLLPKKLYSTSKDVLLSQCLKERTLLQVTGDNVHAFLQGLITNDVEHLQNGAPSIFCMFLNSIGRVKYDSIIYNADNNNNSSNYLVECDSDAIDLLKSHLNLFKVRRKVNISSLQNNMSVWVVVSKNNFLNVTDGADYNEILDFIRNKIPHLFASIDPRMSSLGLRVLAPKNYNLSLEFEKKLGVPVLEENFYQLLRYKLGIGEGLKELPYEKCFPLEANGDYLHGISFHKGCYIGQELTARTYHTGVIRKRLMPLSFEEEIRISEGGIPIFTVPQSEKPIGKLQGAKEFSGVGLLRINEALKADELMVLNTKCKTHCPFWWPSKLPKERIMEKEDALEKPGKEKEEEILWFKCYICDLKEIYHEKVRKSKLAPYISFSAGTYIMKDPFSPAEKKQFFILGSDCYECKNPVCQSNNCSIFYKQRYCQNCAWNKRHFFPEQLRSKINNPN